MDFQGVADGAAEGLVHIRDGEAHFEAAIFADGFKRLGEDVGLFQRVHERAGATFHVDDDGFRATGDLFAEDAADDERDAVYGGGYVSEAVEDLVGGGQIGGLGGESDANLAGLIEELRDIELDLEAGNAGELIDGAASDAESGAGHFDHVESAGGEEGEEDEGGFVANAAGAVFVDPGSRERVEAEAFPARGHGLGQPSGFGQGEGLEKLGHQPSGELVVGDGSGGRALSESFELVGGLLDAVPTAFDDALEIGGHLAAESAGSGLGAKR